MEILTGLYSINGTDVYTAYGLVVRGGTDDFLRYPDRKPPAISKDWADENGDDTDLSEIPVFQSKDISLQIAILADTYDEFWAKYEAFFAELSLPGTIRFYVAEFDRSFYIYYDSITAFSRLTRLKVTGFLDYKIVCTYTIKFTEPVPSFFERFTFLVTKDDDYIVTKDSDKILITT